MRRSQTSHGSQPSLVASANGGANESDSAPRLTSPVPSARARLNQESVISSSIIMASTTQPLNIASTCARTGDRRDVTEV